MTAQRGCQHTKGEPWHCMQLMRCSQPEASPSSSRCTATGTACAPGRARWSCSQLHIKSALVNFCCEHYSQLTLNIMNNSTDRPAQRCCCPVIYSGVCVNMQQGNKQMFGISQEEWLRTSRGSSQMRTHRMAAGTGRCTALAWYPGCCPRFARAARTGHHVRLISIRAAEIQWKIKVTTSCSCGQL
jgi:hypothetical protein